MTLQLWRPRYNLQKRWPFTDMFGDFLNDDFLNETKQKCFSPSIDIKENKSDFELVAELPGIDKKDVNIEVKDGNLTISGKKVYGNDEEKEGYHYRERCYGSFSRSFCLPEGVDENKIKAEFKNGLLKLSIPKPEVQIQKETVKKIDIT
ncbi:MAG: Hsp20/alpha crystallin family protein [Pseudomonadota bacterium]